MKRFDNMSALQQLLNIDTAVFKEELYYPWYVKKSGITAIIVAWSALISMITAIVALFASSKIITVLIIISVITILLSILYITLFKYQIGQAKSEALKQMMDLEKRDFMKSIQPFVAADQQAMVKRITEDKDFTPREYTSVALATQSRVLFNTETFIKDVEKMFSETQVAIKSAPIDESYSETTFKVPEKAKKNYEKMKQESTFNDIFAVPEEAKRAIIKRVQEAAEKSALGRPNHL